MFYYLEMTKLSTRDSIVEVSKVLFAEQGYRGTTVRDISEKANVALSSISYHFNGKEGILLEIISRITDEISNELFSSLDGEISTLSELETRLKIFLNDLILTGIKNWETVKILLTESYELSKFEDVSSLSGYSLYQLIAFFRKAKKNKLINKKFKEEFLADHMMALVMDQILQWKSKTTQESFDISKKNVREKWIESTIVLLVGGVK
jgi:AcrR family transcriptional regulator